jgi:hypothetical protein
MLQGDRLVQQQRTDEPDEGFDNLFQASSGPGSTTGRFGEGSKSTSLYTRILEYHPQRKRVLVFGLVLALVTAIRRIGR